MFESLLIRQQNHVIAPEPIFTVSLSAGVTSKAEECHLLLSAFAKAVMQASSAWLLQSKRPNMAFRCCGANQMAHFTRS